MPRLPGRSVPVAALALALAACASARGGERGAKPLGCPAASFFHPDSIHHFTVSPEGGTYPLTHGHSIHFPAGAIEEPSRYRVQRDRDAFAALRFETVGDAPVTFRLPAVLTLNFAPCGLTSAGRPGFGIYHWAPNDVLTYRGGTILNGRRVSGELDGFSVYAIGTN